MALQQRALTGIDPDTQSNDTEPPEGEVGPGARRHSSEERSGTVEPAKSVAEAGHRKTVRSDRPAGGACQGLAFRHTVGRHAAECHALGTCIEAKPPGLARLSSNRTVNLTGLKLNASLGFASAPNDQFRIINNDVTDAVIGTFTGLPQNAQFYIGGELFQINYAGGTSNDVVLTRLVTPLKPTLTIQRLDTNSVRLLWATNDPAFVLQTSTNLATADWLPVLPLPVVTGANNIVTNLTTESERHYRLRKP